MILGCYVTDGKIKIAGSIKILRADKIIDECHIRNIRHFKDDVKDLSKGFEGGIILKNKIKIEVDDILECYITEIQ